MAHRRICAAGVGELDRRHGGDREMVAVSCDVPVRPEGWVLTGSQPVPVPDVAVALDQNVSPASAMGRSGGFGFRMPGFWVFGN